jgi:hypothetical protein
MELSGIGIDKMKLTPCLNKLHQVCCHIPYIFDNYTHAHPPYHTMLELCLNFLLTNVDTGHQSLANCF